MIHLANLAVNAVYHCINSCVACSHFAPVMPHDYFLDPGVLRGDLGRLSKIATAGKFVFLGGEPLLHPGLVELLKIAKASGISPNIGVLTNGQLLYRMGDDFWESLDCLTVSAYPGKFTDERLVEIETTAGRHGVSLEIWRPAVFNYAYLKHASTDDLADSRFKNCPYNGTCALVDQGFFFRCAPSMYIPWRFLVMGRGSFGYPLSELTEDALDNFLHPNMTPGVCKWCPSNEFRLSWHEAERYEWMEVSGA